MRTEFVLQRLNNQQSNATKKPANSTNGQVLGEQLKLIEEKNKQEISIMEDLQVLYL